MRFYTQTDYSPIFEYIELTMLLHLLYQSAVSGYCLFFSELSSVGIPMIRSS